MKSPFAITLLCYSTATLLTATADQDIPDSNPALFYWQAASLLPELSDAQAEALRDVADGKVKFEPAILGIIDFKGAETFLRKAAASDAPCQWGLAWEDGPEMMVPHLSKVRELSTVSLVLAEASFAVGDTSAGVGHLFVASRIARDAGAGGILIGNLTQHMLEQRTIRLAARHCMDWSDEIRRDFAKRLSALPSLHPLHDAFSKERMWLDWLKQKIGEDPAALDMLFGDLGAGGIGGVPKEPKTIGELIEDYQGIHGIAHAALVLRGESRRAAVAEVDRTIQASDNMLVKLLMPALDSLVRKEDQTFAAGAMLALALEHGPDIDDKDLKGTPFTLLRDDGRLTLSSAKNGFSLSFGE